MTGCKVNQMNALDLCTLYCVHGKPAYVSNYDKLCAEPAQLCCIMIGPICDVCRTLFVCLACKLQPRV